MKAAQLSMKRDAKAYYRHRKFWKTEPDAVQRSRVIERLAVRTIRHIS